MMRSSRREGKYKGGCPTSGFTLVELVIVVAIISVVLTGIYQVFLASYQSQAVVSTDSNFIDNARRAVDAMAKDVRMAGLDPTGAGVFGFNDAGGLAAIATESRVLFKLDQDRDGTLDANTLERVGFRLSGTGIVRTMDGTNQAPGSALIARDVAGLRFEYFTAADARIPDATAQTYTLSLAQRQSIRRIRITVSFSGTAGGLTRNYEVTTDVRPRNL